MLNPNAEIETEEQNVIRRDLLNSRLFVQDLRKKTMKLTANDKRIFVNNTRSFPLGYKL